MGLQSLERGKQRERWEAVPGSLGNISLTIAKGRAVYLMKSHQW